MIFINRSSSSKDHSGDSITLLVISWGAKQDVFQKSVAKRDVSQKSVNIRGCGSQCRGIWGTVVRDGSIALWGSLIFGYCNSTPRITSFLSLIIENDDVVDRIVTKKNITILEIRFLRVFARKRCLSIYLYI
ncbi:hypothetical protein GLOIN_2v1480835 [Rhizophagus irregularis DAOM 181602=DAOM 197198]|nr:hypothetical protein GLOIN_2v1480835 [Rhizophagus irregularis DAOM 181602=DAOM 197198]